LTTKTTFPACSAQSTTPTSLSRGARSIRRNLTALTTSFTSHTRRRRASTKAWDYKSMRCKDHCRIRYNSCLTGLNTLYSTTPLTSISRQSQSCERHRLPCTSTNYLTKVGGIYVIPRDLRSRGLYTIQTPKQSNTAS
jgi:hypothetical protein